jgi:uncharacterized protein YcaQ
MCSAPLRIGRRAAVRFLLEAQHLLAGPRAAVAADAAATTTRAGAGTVLAEIRRLEAVQIDPVAAVERNQHLVLAARLAGYRPPVLEDLVRRRRVFEYWANAACVLPIEDYPLFEGTRRRFRARYAAEMATLRRVVREVLARLEAQGPSPARSFLSTRRVRGAWDLQDARTKATSHVLSLLFRQGEIVVARREGLERFFDLADRAVPAALRAEARALDPREADRLLCAKYLRAYRLADAGDPRFGWQPMTAAARQAEVDRQVREGRLVRVEIEGVRRPYVVPAEDAERLRRHEQRAARDGAPSGGPAGGGPVRFLAPLDNLLWRRTRLWDLFEFAYTWEVYLPAARRRYGHYVMPVLWGDRLIGRFDPQLDRARGRLVVKMLRLEPGVRPSPPLREALAQALVSFARFHDAGRVEIRPAARRVLARRILRAQPA